MTTTLQHMQQRLDSLIEMNQLLMSTVEPHEVLTVVLEAALRLFAAQGCSVALLDETAQELAFVAMAGPAKVEEFRVPLGRGIAGWVAQTGQPVVSNDVSQDRRFFPGIDRQTGFTTRSIMCAALRQHQRIIGVIEVLNTTKPQGFAPDDVQLLTAFGGLAATAITRTRGFARVRNASAAYQAVVQEQYQLVSGTSQTMQETLRLARTVAPTNTTVLLLGESGTGKEVLARAIHQWSPRAEHPFVAINCVALTPELLANELFGHERGAFTGATAQKQGKFELADGGTLFLDEIGELAPELQTKLLRVLQGREFQRVGGVKDIHVDVRILAATNRNLRQAMQSGTFREDLYYRLNVVALTLPALRERRSDIPDLVAYFMDRSCRAVSRPRLAVHDSAMRLLQSYAWPGNIRELQNVIERAVVLAAGPDITDTDLPAEMQQSTGVLRDTSGHHDRIADDLPLADAVTAFKRARVLQALHAAQGNQRLAAERLGLQPSNLSRLMSTLGLR